MSKYENFEKEFLELQYSITAQWDLFKEQAEKVIIEKTKKGYKKK